MCLVLVRPYGLQVRTGRTESPKPTDYKLVLVRKEYVSNRNKEPLLENNQSLLDNNQSLSDNNQSLSDNNQPVLQNVPHFLTFSPGSPIYRGLRHVRDNWFSLTPP